MTIGQNNNFSFSIHNYSFIQLTFGFYRVFTFGLPSLSNMSSELRLKKGKPSGQEMEKIKSNFE